MIPYDRLKLLPNATQYLKPGVTFEQLDEIACAITDNEAAQRLDQVRAELFRSINEAQTGRLKKLTYVPLQARL